MQNYEGKKCEGVIIEEGVPSDPAHTTAENAIVKIVKEHQKLGSEIDGEVIAKDLYQSDIGKLLARPVEEGGYRTREDKVMTQPQLSKALAKLVSEGKLTRTDKGTYYPPA